MSNVVVRPVTPSDSRALWAIYDHAARTTTATMDLTGRTQAGHQAWLDAHDGNPYPLLVAETVEDSVIAGYAALSPHGDKPGYAITAENSVYVHPDWQGVGVGGALLSSLVTDAARRGFYSLVARITVGNEPSVRLHRRYGFAEVGVLRRAGRKFDDWVDVLLMQKMLQKEADQ